MDNKAKKNQNQSEEPTNLGLDADQSSETPYQHLNSDNDRISGNPDGEDDQHDQSGAVGHSPLEDK